MAFRFLALLLEEMVVWYLYVLFAYAEACLAFSFMVLFLVSLEVQRARGQCTAFTAKAAFVTWVAVYSISCLMYIPNRVNDAALVLFSIFCVIALAGAIMYKINRDMVYVEIYGRLIAAAAFLNYAASISPSPDHRMDLVYYAWVKSLCIFFLIGTTMAYVLSLSFVISRWQDKTYGVLQNADSTSAYSDDDEILE